MWIGKKHNRDLSCERIHEEHALTNDTLSRTTHTHKQHTRKRLVFAKQQFRPPFPLFVISSGTAYLKKVFAESRNCSFKRVPPDQLDLLKPTLLSSFCSKYLHERHPMTGLQLMKLAKIMFHLTKDRVALEMMTKVMTTTLLPRYVHRRRLPWQLVPMGVGRGARTPGFWNLMFTL